MSDSHGGGGGGWPLMNLAEGIGHRMHDAGYHTSSKEFIITFIVLNVGFLFLDPYQTLRNWLFIGFFAPLWVPIILTKFTFMQWVKARRAEFIANQKTVLLELRMPRDTKKTPLAMETILSSLHITSGEGTKYAKFWQGKVRTWFSLEIVSIGGRIRFYIWTRAALRRGVEAAFYAQYPGMEIVEAEDYSTMFDPTAHGNDMFGEQWIHNKADVFPIKTYVDYGLDKSAGAEPNEVTDPMAQMLELMGAIGPKEQLWFQMVIRSTKAEKFEGMKNAKGDAFTWKDEAKEEIEKIRTQTVKKSSYVDATGKLVETEGFPNPTKGQSDIINAIERNISKPGFDVGMRGIYTAPKEAYQGSMITFILGTMLKPYASDALNGFKPADQFDGYFNDYPWEDAGGHHREHLHHQIVEYYRRRAFFHDPYVGPWMIMSTEEIATIFHVPSAAIETPSLPRIQSTTSGAPSNLPT